MVDYHTHLNGTRPAKMNYRKTFNGKVITCCIYNVADSLAMIPTVTVMGDGAGAVVSLYIPGTARVKLAGDNEVILEQATDYPRTGRIDILVRPAKTARFPIRLRIPAWSATTLISVNGEPQEAKPGSYSRIDRIWTAGDRISLTLDMRCHLVSSPPGSPQSADTFRALVRGPVVLARDKRLGGDIQEDQFTLYVNGRPVGTGTNWQQPVTMDYQSDLKPGVIVLAVEAANTIYKGPNAAGLLGRVRIEFEEGPPVICFTDGTWKTSDQETPGWQAAGFKDEAWKPARVLGRNGMKPWGALKEFND
jgi:hypothetical protein